ncbi:MAG TPA: amino acid permease, partial [Polyangiaceae bacterium]|nr:amino acid permease [Polyangiaceae bacterium]
MLQPQTAEPVQRRGVEAADRRIGPGSAALLVVASMIGTGVFTTTGFLVRDLRSAPVVLAAWAIGGLVALCGALAYAELVAALPDNGGEYYLLSRIYHPALGFISGFVSLVVGFAAPMAASAIAFGEYLQRLIPALPPLVAALALIGAAAAVHLARVGVGTLVQNATTLLNVALVVLLIGAGVLVTGGATLPEAAPAAGHSFFSSEFALSLVYVSFAYTGWNAAAYVAGEVRRPSRSLPVALVGGTLLVTLLYLGLNWVFLTAAPLEQLAGVVEVGHVAAAHLFGERAATFVTLTVCVGLATTVGALTVTGPRIYSAMGADYPRLRPLVTRSRSGSPLWATWLQLGLAVVMIVTASFDDLLALMGFTLALFSALTLGGVFVLRARAPGLPRPYRTWGHPITTSLAILLMLWMIVRAVSEKPLTSLAVLAIL